MLAKQSALQHINRNAVITRREIFEFLINNKVLSAAVTKKFATSIALELHNQTIGFAKENGLISCQK